MTKQAIAHILVSCNSQIKLPDRWLKTHFTSVPFTSPVTTPWLLSWICSIWAAPKGWLVHNACLTFQRAC